MTSMRDIQPEAFEFEPEFSFGEFEIGLGELENEPFEWPTWPRSRTSTRLRKPFLPDLSGRFRLATPSYATVRSCRWQLVS
jgi:hypothetical protein